MKNYLLTDLGSAYEVYQKDPSIEKRIYTEKSWVVANTYEKLIELIAAYGVPDRLSVQYDFSDPEKNGLDCLKFVIEHCATYDIPFPKIYIHDTSENEKILVKTCQELLIKNQHQRQL